MAVDVTTDGGFHAGSPRSLSVVSTLAYNVGWGLSGDGKKFLFVAPPNRIIPFTVILNWAAGLKK
jgi:hypothetical protein